MGQLLLPGIEFRWGRWWQDGPATGKPAFMLPAVVHVFQQRLERGLQGQSLHGLLTIGTYRLQMEQQDLLFRKRQGRRIGYRPKLGEHFPVAGTGPDPWLSGLSPHNISS